MPACLAVPGWATACQLRLAEEGRDAAVHMPTMAQAEEVLQFFQHREEGLDRRSVFQREFACSIDQVENIGHVTARSLQPFP